jgi:signal transduction protein with GAF and PtsI domain
MTLHELENAVSQLTSEQLATFRDWFHQFESDAWDRQIEADVKAGRLDKFAEEAVAEDAAGRTTRL